MNRLQLREASYDRIGVPQTDATNTTSVVDRLVNDALHEIEVMHEWPWLQTSTTIAASSGTGSYAVPADWLRTRYLQIDGDAVMEGYELGDLIARWPTSTDRGRPYEFTVDGDAVLLRPRPDTAYTVTHYYVKREPDLTSDDQSPLMPASFHVAIAEKAAEISFRRAGQMDRASVCGAAFADWERRMLTDRRRRSGMMRIKVRPGAWT